MAKFDLRKHKVLTAVLLIAAAAVIGSTGATVLHKMTLENPIKTPSVEGEIDEILKGGNKIVTFVNDGEADVFIRAAYSEQWSIEDTILPNPCDESGKKIVSPDISEKWVEGGDGWYYYKQVLPGSVSGKKQKTVEFITGVNFGEEGTLGETYKKASYEIHAVMEVVQASDAVAVSQAAVQDLFGKNITIPEGWDGDKYTYTILWPVQ